MARTMDIHMTAGTTLQSGKIFAINEEVPDNITYTELMLGIGNGTYTKKSLAGKTYSGEVRDRAGGTLRGTLAFNTAGDILTFTLPASITKAWPADVKTLFYNVLETTTSNGIVVEKVKGKIHITPSITAVV